MILQNEANRLRTSDEKPDSLRRISFLDSFFRKKSIKKIRLLWIDSLQIERNVYSLVYV